MAALVAGSRAVHPPEPCSCLHVPFLCCLRGFLNARAHWGGPPATRPRKVTQWLTFELEGLRIIYLQEGLPCKKRERPSQGQRVLKTAEEPAYHAGHTNALPPSAVMETLKAEAPQKRLAVSPVWCRKNHSHAGCGEGPVSCWCLWCALWLT